MAGLTSQQCYELFSKMKTVDEYKSQVEKEDRKTFLKGVYRSCPEKVTISCMGCQRVCQTAYGFFLHLEKCVPETAKPVAMTSDTTSESSSESEEEEEDEFVVEPNFDTKKKLRSSEVVNVTDVLEKPHQWHFINDHRRKKWTQGNFSKPYKCFGHGKGKAPTFTDFDKFYNHLLSCIPTGYSQFKGNIKGFQKIDKKLRHQFIRQEVKARGEAKCMGCDKKMNHAFKAIYHLERCQMSEEDRPWRCYRCKYEGRTADRDDHLDNCGVPAGFKSDDNDPDFNASLSFDKLLDLKGGPTSIPRRRAPNIREGGKIKLRKSGGGQNGSNDVEMGMIYGLQVAAALDGFEKMAVDMGPCETLKNLPKVEWERKKVDIDTNLYSFLNRDSVLIRSVLPRNNPPILETLPDGQRVRCMNSTIIEKQVSTMFKPLRFATPTSAALGFCGGPIASVRLAPNLTSEDEEVVTSVVFMNESLLSSDEEDTPSIVHFWLHKRENNEPNLDLWFTMLIRNQGVVSHSEWLQLPKTEDEPDLIGYLALGTMEGKVLIYRIDESTVAQGDNRVDDEIYVVEPKPAIILTTPLVIPPNEKGANENSTVMEESMMSQIKPPAITSIAWNVGNGGKDIVATNSTGSLVHWNIADVSKFDTPTEMHEDDWMSPAWDVKFKTSEYVIVAFREKILRIIDFKNMMTCAKLNAARTTGTAVYTDQRFMKGIFGYQLDQTAIQGFGTVTGISYVTLNGSSIGCNITTHNDHQLFIYEMTVCPRTGAIISCGADGKVMATVNGLVVMGLMDDCRTGQLVQTPIHLQRRKLGKVDREESVAELMAPKKKSKKQSEQKKETESNTPEPDDPQKDSEQENMEALEKPMITHDDVCANMWIDIDFESLARDAREQEPHCILDRRIESLTTIAASSAANVTPSIFTGGEAGLLIAVSCTF